MSLRWICTPKQHVCERLHFVLRSKLLQAKVDHGGSRKTCFGVGGRGQLLYNISKSFCCTARAWTGYNTVFGGQEGKAPSSLEPPGSVGAAPPRLRLHIDNTHIIKSSAAIKAAIKTHCCQNQLASHEASTCVKRLLLCLALSASPRSGSPWILFLFCMLPCVG